MTATQPPLAIPALHAPATATLTNPNLSAALRLEYDALLSDVRRAHELCAEFQRQLAGKSSEAADLKELFAKTQSDLFQLQDSIAELREERHRLANEAMRAAALSRKLAEVTVERDRLLAAIAVAEKDARPASPAGVEKTVVEMLLALKRLQTALDFAEAPNARLTSPNALAESSLS